jgi:hypothetical protein
MDINSISGVSSASNTSETSIQNLPGVRTFKQKIQQAVKAGNFDAAKLAQDAPQALRSYAQKNGIALEKLVTQLSNG